MFDRNNVPLKLLLVTYGFRRSPLYYGRLEAMLDYLNEQTFVKESYLFSLLGFQVVSRRLKSYIKFLKDSLSSLLYNKTYLGEIYGKTTIIEHYSPIIPRTIKQPLDKYLHCGILCEHSFRAAHGASQINNAIERWVKKGKRQTPPICICGGPQCGLEAFILEKRYRLFDFLVYEDPDFFAAFHEKTEARRQVERLEAYAVKQADLVVSVSNILAKIRTRQGAKRVMTVQNGVDPSFFEKAVRTRSMQKKNSIRDTLVFAGSWNKSWGVDMALRALPIVKKSLKVKLLLVGGGSEEAMLKKLAKEMNIRENVKFIGRVEREMLPYYLGLADIGIAPYRPGFHADYGDPVKVKEYMSAGLPVVSTRVGEVPDLLARSHGGVAVDFDEESFADSVIHLLTNKDEYEFMIKKGREYVNNNFNWNALFNKEFDAIISMISN